MMHLCGRYADAAELIRQELALYPPNAEVYSPLLLPLKIRFIHHQMFYRPVSELWPQMLDLLACCDGTQDPRIVWRDFVHAGRQLGEASRELQRSAGIFIAFNTPRQAAERSLHSVSVSAQVWRLSS